VDVRYREEALPINQGKLTLGYRTNTSYQDDDYFSLLLYNGILGAFPHSKLFQNVREKASLAYYAFSRLEKHKGIQLIGSGIEIENYQQALEIIQEQVELIKQGNISREEMENTKRGLINQYKILGDSPYSLVNFFLDGVIGGREEGIDYFINKIEGIKKDDVVEASNKVFLDTIYFLRSSDGEGGEKS
jgi:predicted Zn-dependent peptidase